MLLIDQGEKKLIKRTLLDEDGVAIPFSSITALEFTFVSNSQERYTFSIANGDIIQDETDVALELEEETTADFNRGEYDLKATIEVDDTRFTNSIVDIQTQQDWARVLGAGEEATGDTSSVDTGTITFKVLLEAEEISAPTVSNSEITSSDETEISVQINWEKATSNDPDTSNAQLIYKVYRGNLDLLNSVGTITSQTFLGSANNINSFVVSTDQTINVNVSVEDLQGNKSVYNATQISALDPQVIGITTTTSDFTGDPNDTFQINGEVEVQDGEDDTLLFETLDASVATVNSSGLVTLQDGSAENFQTQIRGYAQADESYEFFISVTVNQYTETNASSEFTFTTEA